MLGYYLEMPAQRLIRKDDMVQTAIIIGRSAMNSVIIHTHLRTIVLSLCHVKAL